MDFNQHYTNCAPVILFTYNRINVLEKTIECLSKNIGIENSDLYIFSDGPSEKKNGDIKKVNQVRNYLDNMENFSKSKKIIKREKNIGLANSIISGLNEISRIYDKFIVLEDDLLTSKYFLSYMNNSLDEYKDNENIWTINGMSLNPDVLKVPDNYEFDTYFIYRASSHGWGTWSKKWNQAKWDNQYFKDQIFSFNNQIEFNKGGNDLSEMLKSQINNEIDSWSIKWNYIISKNNGLCLSPRHSYISAQEDKDGTHIKTYLKSINNNLSLSKNIVSYPNTEVVNLEIARNFALNYDSNLPKILNDYKQDNVWIKKYEKGKQANLKVTSLSLSSKGGAGVAALRTVRAIDSFSNISIELLTENNDISNPLIRSYKHNKTKTEKSILTLFNNNIYKGSTPFSFAYPSLTYSDLDSIVQNSDVLHLHWTPRYLSNEAISYLSYQNKPLVWTFHDKYPFTGGCHYFQGCENWKINCDNCPQLKNNFDNLSRKVFDTKLRNFNFENITVVVLNNEFKKLVKESPMFEGSRIEVIPNCIDTNFYKPVENGIAKKKFNVPHDKKIILYAASYNSDIKGFKEFNKSINFIENKEHFHVLTVGKILEDYKFNISHTHLGYLDQQDLISVYSAADVTVISSIEDNLPNILLESLSCGTPVVCFEVGGLKDHIQDGYNGYKVKLFDIKSLSEKIIQASEDSKRLSKNSREYAVENFNQENHASKFQSLYYELASKKYIKKRIKNTNEVFEEMLPSYNLVLAKATKLQNKEKLRLTKNKIIRFFILNNKTKINIFINKLFNNQN